jgi:hypothetical protein
MGGSASPSGEVGAGGLRVSRPLRLIVGWTLVFGGGGGEEVEGGGGGGGGGGVSSITTFSFLSGFDLSFFRFP